MPSATIWRPWPPSLGVAVGFLVGGIEDAVTARQAALERAGVSQRRLELRGSQGIGLQRAAGGVVRVRVARPFELQNEEAQGCVATGLAGFRTLAPDASRWRVSTGRSPHQTAMWAQAHSRRVVRNGGIRWQFVDFEHRGTAVRLADEEGVEVHGDLPTGGGLDTKSSALSYRRPRVSGDDQVL